MIKLECNNGIILYGLARGMQNFWQSLNIITIIGDVVEGSTYSIREGCENEYINYYINELGGIKK